MKNRTTGTALSNVMLATAFLLGGCGYPIKYRLNDTGIVRAKQALPLRVQIATFADRREPHEHDKKARKAEGYNDVNDFSYDKGFHGNEAEEITKMLAAHLTHSRVFASAQRGTFSSEGVSDSLLAALAQAGVEAVLTGEIENFYGYYDQNPGRQFLYAFGLGLALGLPVYLATGPQEETTRVGNVIITETTYNTIPGSIATSIGVSLGYYLESTHKRNIERHTKLTARLLNTSTRATLWQDTFEIHEKELKAMPGLNTENRKYEVAVAALREAVNKIVESLETAELRAGEN